MPILLIIEPSRLATISSTPIRNEQDGCSAASIAS